MNRSTWLLIFQGLGVSLQMINASLTVIFKDEALAIVVAAVIGGFQFVIQHLGNGTVPEVK